MATLTRWHPLADLADLQSTFDRMFGRPAEGRNALPAIDVIREDDRLVIKADMPGLACEDVKIRVENGILTVSGEHEEKREVEEEKYLRRERSYGSFSRSLALPDGVDPDSIEATAKDGVVEVTVPLPDGASREPVEITPRAAD